MSENQLRQAFAEIAAEVKVAPEPYRRILERDRKLRRRQVAGWAGVVASGLAILLFGPIGLQGMAGHDTMPAPSADPRPRESGYPFSETLNAWTRTLIDAPTKGELAGTPLADELTDLLRGWPGDAAMPITVLYAGDVGDKRLVVAAGTNGSVQTGYFLAGARGASAAQLFATFTARPLAVSLRPFTRVSFVGGVGPVTEAGVALAPTGCQIFTAPATGQPWQPAPGGNYLVWSEPAGTLVSKVECSGTTRFSGPLSDPGSVISLPVADSAIGQATSGMRGSVPSDVAASMLEFAAAHRPAGPVRFLYGGTVPGDTQPTYVAVFPLSPGHWGVLRGSDKSGMTLEPMAVADPLGAHTVLAVWGHDTDTYHVFAPPEAVTLDVRDAAGNPLLTVPLKEGVGMFTAKGPLQLRAMDAAGREVATGQAPPTFTDDLTPMRFSENW